MEGEIACLLYKYYNKFLPATFEGMLSKKILSLSVNLGKLGVNLLCFVLMHVLMYYFCNLLY